MHGKLHTVIHHTANILLNESCLCAQTVPLAEHLLTYRNRFLVMSICSRDAIKIHCRLTGVTCSKVPDFWMVGHVLYINSSQKYVCSFVVTF